MVKEKVLSVVGLAVMLSTLITLSACTSNDPIDVMYIEDIYTENDTGSWVLITGNATIAGSGEGVTDHGLLTGLGDDDHSQYILDIDLTNHESDTSTHGVSEVADVSEIVTDHGALNGLGDDDHSQYSLDSDLNTHSGLEDTHG